MLNQSMINEAVQIDHSEKVAKVAKFIRQQANSNGYVSELWMPDKRYLNIGEISAKLIKMDYYPKIANELAKWIRTNTQNAYERGVFVVTDRVLGNKEIVADCKSALLAALRHNEPMYFDAIKWYPDGTYSDALSGDNWEHDICLVIGSMTLLYSRAAFTNGMKDACNALVVK
jgi:hypothetical protein